MTALAEKRSSLGALAGLAVVLLIAGIATLQYLRAGWPFVREHAGHDEAEHVHQPTAQPAPMQDSAAMEGSSEHSNHGGAEMPPPGYAAVTLDPAQTQALQMTTASVEEREFHRVARSVGVVTLDETRSAHVHSKIRGWIRGIDVNFVGKKVRAGAALCSIYSQEVYAAEIELLSMLGAPGTQAAPSALLQAARQRLALWDVPRSEVERLEATRQPKQTFALLAPRAGTVIAKQAIEGMYVDPSLELYTLSDLSRVWALVDLYETDVPYVHVGDHARLSIEGVEGAVDAAVAFLSPTIDEATRTRKVRFELTNEAGSFLPGAFASAEIELAMGRGLAVPESAVIRTGTRSIVFVVHGEHGEHIVPREVQLGPLMGNVYRIESGLQAGERVATGAQFLLDSESRLRASSAPGGGHVH